MAFSKSTPRILLLALLGVTLLAATASAVPKLQLYIPGGEYVETSTDPWLVESWVSSSNTFELWMLASSAADALENIRISMAILEEDMVAGNTITISWAGVAPVDYPGYGPGEDPFYEWNTPEPSYIPETGSITLTYEDFVVGYPQIGDPRPGGSLIDMPAHGVYPTPFAELYMGRLDTPNGTDQVWDAQVPLEDATSFTDGIIYKLSIEIDGFQYVHFDAHDGTWDQRYKATFAPFSHDGTGDGDDGSGGPTPPIVPEPATVFLLGSVAVGALLAGRKRS